MKSLVISLFIIAFGLSGYTQDCMSSEYLKQGSKWEIANFDKKGKHTGSNKYEVLTSDHSDGKSTWKIKMESIDKKGESINDGSTEIFCENGVYKMDMSQMVPAESMQSMQSMEVTMDGSTIDYPIGGVTEAKLEDAHITLTAATSGMVVMNMKLTITNRKIEGSESVTTPAGTFECLKISQDTQIENKMFKRNYSTTSWFLPGFGIVKTESYDHKNKLMGTSELSSITH